VKVQHPLDQIIPPQNTRQARAIAAQQEAPATGVVILCGKRLPVRKRLPAYRHSTLVIS